MKSIINLSSAKELLPHILSWITTAKESFLLMQEYPLDQVGRLYYYTIEDLVQQNFAKLYRMKLGYWTCICSFLELFSNPGKDMMAGQTACC